MTEGVFGIKILNFIMLVYSFSRHAATASSRRKPINRFAAKYVFIAEFLILYLLSLKINGGHYADKNTKSFTRNTGFA